MTQVTLFSYNPSRTHVIFIFLRGGRTAPTTSSYRRYWIYRRDGWAHKVLSVYRL